MPVFTKEIEIFDNYSAGEQLNCHCQLKTTTADGQRNWRQSSEKERGTGWHCSLHKTAGLRRRY